MKTYENSKLYKYVNKNDESIYFIDCANTSKYLSRIIGETKYKYKQYKIDNKKNKNLKPLFKMFDDYGVENFKIELIENN